MEPRRVDLDALLNEHAFMRVERSPTLWQVDVLDEPFIRMLGEVIVVGLLHQEQRAELTLNVSNVTVGEDGPPGPGDYVAMTTRGRGDWGPEVAWSPRINRTSLERGPRRRRARRRGIVRLPAAAGPRRGLDHGAHPSRAPDGRLRAPFD